MSRRDDDRIAGDIGPPSATSRAPRNGNGGGGRIDALEQRVGRIEERLTKRLDRIDAKLDESAKTVNTMKGTIDTWKWIVPVAIAVAGVIGGLLARL